MRFVLTSHKELTGRLFLLTEPLISLSNHITRSISLDTAKIIN